MQKIKEMAIYNNDNSHIFSELKFIIPNYQRNYSWEFREIEQMIDDIEASNGKYFLGNLVVKKNDEGGEIYYVIDGQQRLTTVYILFKYLEIFSIPDNALSFQAREKSDYTLKNLSSNLKENFDPDCYSEEIFSGFNNIDNILKQRIGQYSIEHLKNRMRSTIFLLVEVPDGTNLNHYFEIMNTRSQQLEQQDIVKAFLMSKLENKDQEVFAWIWNACENMDNYIQMSLTPRNIRLRTEIFGYNWDKITIDNFNNIKDKYINNFEGKDDGHDEIAICDILEPSSEIGKEDKIILSKESVKDKEEENSYSSIITFPYFLIHALTIFSRQESSEDDDAMLDDTKMIDRFKKYFNNTGSREETKKFIVYLLKAKFYFDNYIIKRENPKTDNDEGKWLLQKLKKTDESDKPVNSFGNNMENLMIQSCLRITYTSPKSMHWITKLLSANNENDTVVLLEKYIREKLPSKEEFEKWDGYNYPHLCSTYLDFLLWRIDKNNDFKFQYRTSIEHFYPQKVDKSQGFFELVETALHSFGNLALISVSGNAKFSNAVPEAKKENFPQIMKQSLKLEALYKKISGYKSKDELTVLINQHYIDMLKILYP